MDARTPPNTTLDALARAAGRIFRPLVRILLRHNVSFKTCSDWLRWCYADVAFREFRIPGRKQTKSRVAVLTGLTRVDVNQLLATPPPEQTPQQEQYHRAALVLSGWAHDPEFRVDAKPIPALPFEAEGNTPSFSALVARHSGGAPARAVLDELERSGAVRIGKDRSIELVRTRYISRANDTDLQTSEIFGMACGDLMETIAHNWQPETEDKRLQLLVYNRAIHPDLHDEVRRRVEDAARGLAEQVDELLYDYQQRSHELDPSKDAKPVRLGLGLYSIHASPEPRDD